MARYGKALVSVIAAVALTLYTFLNDNHISAEEWVQVCIAFTVAINVYLVPLTPEWPWMKTAVAAVTSLLNALVIVIVGGLDQQEILTLVIAVLTPFGVAMAPAVSDNGQPSNP
jgi:hypothetical protein